MTNEDFIFKENNDNNLFNNVYKLTFISIFGIQYTNQSNVKMCKFFNFAKEAGKEVNKLLFIVKTVSNSNFPIPSGRDIILLYEISIYVNDCHSWMFSGKLIRSLCAIESTCTYIIFLHNSSGNY